MNIHMQRQTTGMPYLLKDKQCIQQITRPKMGKKNASERATITASITDIKWLNPIDNYQVSSQKCYLIPGNSR